MSSASVPSAGRPQRPFQFTIRQLMLLMTIVCVLGGALYWWEPIAIALSVLIPIAGSILILIGFLQLKEKDAWTALLALVALAGILIALLLPAVSSRPPSGRMACGNHLKQIGLAIHNYHDVYGSLPPAYVADANGKPMHSWRVLILPFCEGMNTYNQYNFNEPWDGPNNSKLANQMPPCFRCPSRSDKQPKMETSYVAVIGPQTMWPGEKATKMSDLTDGTSNTIMVVEVHNSGIHWMEPRDLHVGQMPMAVNPPRGQGISSAHPRIALAVFADGHTGPLTERTPPDMLRAMLTRAGGERIWELDD